MLLRQTNCIIYRAVRHRFLEYLQIPKVLIAQPLVFYFVFFIFFCFVLILSIITLDFSRKLPGCIGLVKLYVLVYSSFRVYIHGPCHHASVSFSFFFSLECFILHILMLSKQSRIHEGLNCTKRCFLLNFWGRYLHILATNFLLLDYFLLFSFFFPSLFPFLQVSLFVLSILAGSEAAWIWTRDLNKNKGWGSESKNHIHAKQ